jgi:hypothetical protein
VLGVTTTADELLARARQSTGLTDLGPDTFHEGLASLVDGAADAPLNELGIMVLHGQAVELLSIRLHVEDWYRRHPEIDEQEIPTPLVGLGLPRTGSTALSFLLAQDPGTRSLLAWEVGAPTPPPEPGTYTTDPRIAEAAARAAVFDQFAPKFRAMLPTAPDGPTECLSVLALDFRSGMFKSIGDNRGYGEWLEQCDMVPAYEYHRRVLKLLQWKFPPRPWRLKSPMHMHTIPALLEVYPGAKFVMTHRDVTQVIPSVVNLLDVMSEPLRSEPLAPDFADNEAAFWERALRKALAYRDAGHEDEFFDIQFADLQADPLDEMGRLYTWLGDDLSDVVAGRMRSWWEESQRERHSGHDHDPEDHGIDLDALRSRFAFYRDRFVGH